MAGVMRSRQEPISGPGITEIRTITKEEMDHAKEDIKTLSDTAYTLCETIRRIYHRANEIIDDSELKEDIQDKCVMALAFSKRMDRKLRKYKLNTIEVGDDKI